MSFSIRKIGMLEMPKIAMLSTAVYTGKLGCLQRQVNLFNNDRQVRLFESIQR